MNNKCLNYIAIAVIITTLVVGVLFMKNSTYNGALIERGLLKYHPITGELGWVDENLSNM